MIFVRKIDVHMRFWSFYEQLGVSILESVLGSKNVEYVFYLKLVM